MAAPLLTKPIPPQVINEQAAYGPFDLNAFIQIPEGTPLFFTAELKDGAALPQGVICTSDGILTGIPAKGTEGLYEIALTVHGAGETLITEFVLTIQPSLASIDALYFNELKAQVWGALEQRLPLPDISDFYDHPVSPQDVYYLLERFGVLKIWDAFNLESPGELKPLLLKGASPEFHVYDRGSCLVACPKDLFSDKRTLADGLQTARAMAREVYKRHWTIELVGLDKYMRAAWVELQHLGDLYGKKLSIINYNPTSTDIALYRADIPGTLKPGLSGD